jgi:hypothetical protein
MARVAQAGHGPWGVAGTQLAGVLGEGGVADVVQRLDAPMPSDVVGQASRAGLGGGEAGDRVHRHGTPAAAVQGPDPRVMRMAWVAWGSPGRRRW